jgi:Ca2+-binding EF-hand superfamily protein
MELADKLMSSNTMPSDDDFIPALLLITRFCCKERWKTTISEGDGMMSFATIDSNNDGVLDHDEVRTIVMNSGVGGGRNEPPEEWVLDDMISAIDYNGDGIISEE